MVVPKAKTVLMLLGFLIALVGGLYWVFTNPELKPVVISVYAPPIIKSDTPRANMGDVKTDSEVTHTFYLYNVGGSRLVIDRVEPSCGCTVANLSTDSVLPGDFAKLRVTLDTSIKLGKVQKKISVYSNDPQQPKLDLFLVGKVLPNMQGHGKIEVKDPLVLFKGKCASCHVDQGKGKSGKSLFQADCGMCHGLNAQGAVSKSLLTLNYSSDEALNRIRQVIARGAENTPTMPPFSSAHGGPLSEAQIDSLVTFLEFQAEQARLGLLDKDGEPL